MRGEEDNKPLQYKDIVGYIGETAQIANLDNIRILLKYKEKTGDRGPNAQKSMLFWPNEATDVVENKG